MVLTDLAAHPVQVELQDLQERQDPLVAQELQVLTVHLVLAAYLAVPELQVNPAPPVLLEAVVQAAKAVHPELVAHQERQVSQVLPVLAAHQALAEVVVHQV